jgi:hypothetical protein
MTRAVVLSAGMIAMVLGVAETLSCPHTRGARVDSP